MFPGLYNFPHNTFFYHDPLKVVLTRIYCSALSHVMLACNDIHLYLHHRHTFIVYIFHNDVKVFMCPNRVVATFQDHTFFQFLV